MLTYRVYRLYDIANPSSKHRDEILSHSLHYDSSTINAPDVFAFEHPVQELLLPPCTGPRTTGEEGGERREERRDEVFNIIYGRSPFAKTYLS